MFLCMCVENEIEVVSDGWACACIAKQKEGGRGAALRPTLVMWSLRQPKRRAGPMGEGFQARVAACFIVCGGW